MLKNFKLFCETRQPKRVFVTIAKEVIKTTFLKEDSPPIEIEDIPLSRYGGESTVTLIYGSKVGEQGADYIQRIFNRINAPIELELLETNKEKHANENLLSVMRNGAAIYIDSTHELESKRKTLYMNTQLDLFACIVNCFSIPGFGSKFPGLDLAIVMQNNRGDFSKLEYEPVKGVIETLKICERKSIERYINYTFKYAISNNRKKITFGHKSSELPLADGLHLATAKKLHQEKYPNIDIEFMMINDITRHLIWDPTRFDILCLDDKYGTFIATVASGVTGGASLFSSSEVSDQHAIFKPLQTKLSITDSGALSPYGTVSTAVNLLQHLGYHDCASTLWRGLMKVMIVDKIKTCEYGGECSEEDVICKLLDNLQESACQHI